MAHDLVLITGVTGHVGFRVLQYALDHGYSVRAVVRSDVKANKVKSSPAFKATIHRDRVEFVVVPDFATPGAFDEAATGVKYVTHCASPMPFSAPTTDNAENDFIRPSVKATLSLLDTAAKHDTIERVVITSSCIAVAPVVAAVSDTGETYTAYTRQPEATEPFPPATPSFVAYAASKVSALNAAEKWMKQNNPSPDVVHLMPSYVLAREDLCDSVEEMEVGPNKFILDIVRGTMDSGAAAGGMAMVVNHIDDCARIHVEALNKTVKGKQSFMICYNCASRPQWDEAKAIVAKHFPEAVESGLLPCQGSLKSICCRLESKETEEVFGFRDSFEDAVVSTVQQYLELTGNA